MKVLITSGGTKIPIDQVRHIGNMSSGTFGAKIGTELLQMRRVDKLIFLGAVGSKTPMSMTVDFNKNPDFEKQIGDFWNLWNFYRTYSGKYTEVHFKTFDEYHQQLETLCKQEQPDVVILACAASDYGVNNPLPGKMRSNEQERTIQLSVLPKLIGKVKEWCPSTRLVGFKLLVNSDLPDLVDAAWKSLEDNQCDLVVANDLRDIKANNQNYWNVWFTRTVNVEVLANLSRRIGWWNFFKGTTANFTTCGIPDQPPDYISGSGSYYWDLGDRVVRWSDHWGEVASCMWQLWQLDDDPYGLCGECLYIDFR